MEDDKKKAIAAVSSVVWSALLTISKLIVGILTGSLGILSEALHSALDLLAAGGTLYAVKVAARPADDEHPYGHGKVENLMALGETLLLLITAGWVIKESIERLTSDDPAALHVEVTVWAFLVIIASLVVDINRARMLKRVARETKSAALEADAAHFATDIWSSVAVLLGICGAATAGMAVEGSWFHWLLMRADVFASLIVALLILSVCRHLGMEAINNLMDKANGETSLAIHKLMKERMPAYPLERLRVREVGNNAYVEMVVLAPADLHVDTAHEIAEAIEELIRSALPHAETMVHIHPAEHEATEPQMVVRRIALTHRFGVHGLVFHHSEQGYIIFTDLELPPGVQLDSWSVPIRAFCNEVRRRLGADRVVVHVEPDVRAVPQFSSVPPAPEVWQAEIRSRLLTMGAPLPTQVNIYSEGDRRLCIVNIPQEHGLTVAESHARLSLLTKRLQADLPPVARVIVAYDAP